jgi:hypothetical protein
MMIGALFCADVLPVMMVHQGYTKATPSSGPEAERHLRPFPD